MKLYGEFSIYRTYRKKCNIARIICLQVVTQANHKTVTEKFDLDLKF